MGFEGGVWVYCGVVGWGGCLVSGWQWWCFGYGGVGFVGCFGFGGSFVFVVCFFVVVFVVYFYFELQVCLCQQCFVQVFGQLGGWVGDDEGQYIVFIQVVVGYVFYVVGGIDGGGQQFVLCW